MSDKDLAEAAADKIWASPECLCALTCDVVPTREAMVQVIRGAYVDLQAEVKRLRANANALQGRTIELEAEVEALREIVAKLPNLPKTADGVPVVPGMRVWYWDQHLASGVRHLDANIVRDIRVVNGQIWINIDNDIQTLSPNDCYSTREAAEAQGGAS